VVERAERIGVAVTSVRPSDAVVVIDLPDPSRVAAGVPIERLAVFDDVDAFRGEAGLVIQPSMPEWAGSGRAIRVLAGFSYAPVARAFVELRDVDRPADAAEPEVLVCFGGSDPALVTERLARILAFETPWRSTIVVGVDYSGAPDDLPPNVVRDPDDLPARLARADLAVIGAGTMKFEVACVRRPAILLAVADDQLAAGPPFASTGAAEYLGDGRTIAPDRVLAAVRGLVDDRDRRLAMGQAAASVVDGLGAERIASAILSMAEAAST
jgi:spore coat polysaccharide biosynthesis predicted glycosyltransferase SpsG